MATDYWLCCIWCVCPFPSVFCDMKDILPVKPTYPKLPWFCYRTSPLLFWHAPLGVQIVVRRHQPPQRAVLGQVDCFVRCEVVSSRISLDGVQPCVTRTTWWYLPVLWWRAIRIIKWTKKVELANPGSAGKSSLKLEEVEMEVMVALPLMVGQLEDVWTIKHLNSNYPPYVVFWETGPVFGNSRKGGWLNENG